MNLSPLPVQKFFGNDGQPLVGGQLFTYVAGTSTKQATYTDSSGGTPNTNPIVLDYRGEARVWIDPTLSYKFVLAPATDTDPPTHAIWTVDNITAAPANQDNAAVDTGSVNAIALSIPQISSPVAFTRIVFKVANTNTGPVTITINGGTAKNLRYQNTGAFGGGEIIAGGIYEAVFDGTQWQLQGPAVAYWRTAAEIAASVTPTNYSYPPGDLRRYGGIADGTTNNATALSNACLQAAQTGGAPVYVYGNSTGFKVSTGVSLAAPILIYGDILGTSRIFTAADITILTIPFAASGSVISDIKFNGPGTGTSTKAVIELNNSNGNVFRRVYASAGKYGIYFNKGINSCYLNALHDCQIISNGTTNIHCEGNTNALYMSNCTIGGAPCAKGLYMVDSNNLSVIGGDAEGLTTCVFDLDATSTLQASHYISGFHFEGNTSSGGDVRIGNTAAVNGIALVGNLYAPGTGNDSAINAIRGDGLAIIGGDLHSGYTGVSFYRIGASFGRYTIMGVGQQDNITNELTMAGGLYQKRVTVTYSASMTIDCSLGNVFEIVATNGTAFTINAPTNAVDGQVIYIYFGNSSGGAHGTGTMNSAFKLAGGGSSLPAVATGNNRTFIFVYRAASSAWYEGPRPATDVPN